MSRCSGAFESLNTLTTVQSDLYSAEEWISLTGEAILAGQHTGNQKSFRKELSETEGKTIILVMLTIIIFQPLACIVYRAKTFVLDRGIGFTRLASRIS